MMPTTTRVAVIMPTVRAMNGAKRSANTSVGTAMMNDQAVPSTGAKDMTSRSPSPVVQLMTKLAPSAMLRRTSSMVTPPSMEPDSSMA